MIDNKLIKLRKVLIFAIFIVLPLGYFARINLGSIFIGLYYWDVLLCVYIALSMWLYRAQYKKLLVDLPEYYMILFAFILYASLATLNSYRYLDSLSELTISSLYLIRWVIYVISGVFLYKDFVASNISRQLLINLLILEGILISILGFLQLIFIPDFTLLDKSLMWDPHQNRLSGLYFDPNFAGIILVLILTVLVPVILNLVEASGKSLKEKKQLIVYILCFVSIFLAIVLTFSRSTWLALAIVILVVGLIKYKWIIPIALLGMFLVYYAVPRVQTRISGVTDPTDSFHFRFISWSETYEVAKTNPLIGYGFNTYRYIRQDMGLISYDEGAGDRSDAGSDSSLLFVWVTTGLIGLAIFVVAHVKLFFKSLTQAKHGNAALFFTGFLVALLVNSQFINSYFFPALNVNYVILTAIFLSSRQEL